MVKRLDNFLTFFARGLRWRQMIPCVFVALVVGLGACEKFFPEKTEESENTIRIASILPLTGAAAQLGDSMRMGQEMATEYWHSQHPDTLLQLKIEDSKSLPSEATKAFHSLLAQDFKFYITTLSNVGLALKPLFIRNSVLALISASHPDITRPPHPLIFRHSQTAEAEASVILEGVEKVMGSGVLTVYYLDDEYGRAIIDYIRARQHDDRILRMVPFTKDTQDLRSVVQADNSALRSKNDAANAIIVVGVGQQMGRLIQSIREQGYQGPIFGTLGYLMTGARNVLGQNVDNIHYTSLRWRTTPATQWFELAYQRRHGVAPPAIAAIEFQNVLAMAQAIRASSDGSVDGTAAALAGAVEQIMGIAPTGDGDIYPLVELHLDGPDND